MFVVDVATTSSYYSGVPAQVTYYYLCSSKYLSEWSVWGRKQQISAACPTPHYFTSPVSSEHPKYLILSL